MQAFPDHEDVRKVLKVLYYLFPLLALLFFVLAAATSVCTLRTIAVRIRYQKVSRLLILRLMVGVNIAYVSSVSHDSGLPWQQVLATSRANARQARRRCGQHNEFAQPVLSRLALAR